MFKDWFQKKKYATISVYNGEERKPDNALGNKNSKDKEKSKENRLDQDDLLDENIWVKCKACDEIVLRKDIEGNKSVCPKCEIHLRKGSRARLAITIDEGTFVEYDENLESENPLDFPDYEEKLEKAQKNSGEKDAVITGEGEIEGSKCVICVMDSNFMMGSMGSVVGEKISRAIENAIDKKLPLIIFCASGGARMQEGILSLMQMAKTSAALGKLSDAGLLYISVLTDPTTGGVTASFAMLGDIIISEPNAQIGFAGRRVIEQTIKQTLPDEFQTAEFLKEKGFIDKIVKRKDLKSVLAKILRMHGGGVSYE